MPRWADGHNPGVEFDEWGRRHPSRRQYKAFIWPHGGKRRSKWGRCKDIASGKGPDIFIATNPNRPVSATDGPSTRQWTNLTARDYYWDEEQYVWDKMNRYNDSPFGRRAPNYKVYDFDKRRYRTLRDGHVTSAWYYPESKMASRKEFWPGGREADYHPAPRGAMDPRNFGSARPLHGLFGMGGWWHPGLNGWPPLQPPLQANTAHWMMNEGFGGWQENHPFSDLPFAGLPVEPVPFNPDDTPVSTDNPPPGFFPGFGFGFDFDDFLF